MASYIVNEMLCVLQNNFGKLLSYVLVNVYSEFYTEDEVKDAKRVLMEFADSLSPKPDELRRIKSQRIGVSKHRHAVEDLSISLLVLDNRKHPMPRFLAADTSRVPSFKDVELCKVTASIAELTSKVTDLMKPIIAASAMTQRQSDNTSSSLILLSSVSPPTPAEGSNEAGAHWIKVGPGGRPLGPLVSFANIVASTAMSTQSPRTLASPAPLRRKATGTKMRNVKISAATPSMREKSWHLFIGRLNKDTKTAGAPERF